MSYRAIALSLCMAGGLAVSSASALPLVKSGEHSAASDAIVHVDYRKNYKKAKHRFEPGNRYSKPPKNWHRYGKRPGNWRMRGCIIVGPVWFCP